jgi:predicted nucleic acid-binding protein
MHLAILDTNVYIGHWARGLFEEKLEAIRRAFIVRHSAVVLSELRRGARTRDAERLVASLFRLASVRWEPTAADWWEAGRVVRKIGDAEGWDRAKRRDFQNDTLIALTARRHGATVVTADLADFELLARELHISVLSVR